VRVEAHIDKGWIEERMKDKKRRRLNLDGTQPEFLIEFLLIWY